MGSHGGGRTLARLRRRAITSKAPRQRWHSRRSWQCGFCKLQTLQGLTGFESHPLRQLSTYDQIVYRRDILIACASRWFRVILRQPDMRNMA